ncbi:MAG: 8-amino-7-oxononanoate synthase [Nitrospiria bacterium]
MDQFEKELASLKNRDLHRTLTAIESEQSASMVLGHEKILTFCSNNYLGLANHPALKKAAVSAIQTWGVGAGASRLISGNLQLYRQLEKRLAEFKSTESTLVFNSGYGANTGAIPAITKKGDLLLSDRLNHASLVAGCRLSEATFRIYRHKDMDQLQKLLADRKKNQNAFIVTDGIFSMDGDIAPLPEIIHLAELYDAAIYLDDAHATGVLGASGRGSPDYFQTSSVRLIQMGTFSKALGSFGGFIAGRKTLVDVLINKAKSFIYTTALPPSVLATSLAALDVIQQDKTLRERLWTNTHYFHQKVSTLGFQTFGSKTPIVPIRIGNNEKALIFSKQLFQNKIYIPAIRPPTIPKGTARLRVTLMASHTQEQIDTLLFHLEKIGKELRII